MGNERKIFREKAMERISSPEQMTEYLKVTNPGVWLILSSVFILLIGVIVWASIGTLKTTADVKVVVHEKKAEVVLIGEEKTEAGMTLTVASKDFIISSVKEDLYGRYIAYTEVDLPDGEYSGEIVIEEKKPIDFLLEGR